MTMRHDLALRLFLLAGEALAARHVADANPADPTLQADALATHRNYLDAYHTWQALNALLSPPPEE
ncbi:MAG: hypothetical protein ACYC3L_01300 [Gemmatimonadaceae bacterium]